MSIAVEKLIAAFDSLPVEEQRVVINELLLRVPFDSGSLDDNEVAAAGDQLAAILSMESARQTFQK